MVVRENSHFLFVPMKNEVLVTLQYKIIKHKDMPTLKPTISFQELRNFMEKWSWIDPVTEIRTNGYNYPPKATEVQRVAFFVKYVTQEGVLEEGNAICLKVDRRRHQRKIQFVKSGEIRRICDYLVIECDGARILTH